MLTLPVALVARFRQQSWDKGLLQGLQDDLRDNILNYDEQGGGEEDQVRAGVVRRGSSEIELWEGSWGAQVVGGHPGSKGWGLPRSPPCLPQIRGTCLGKVPGMETPPCH